VPGVVTPASRLIPRVGRCVVSDLFSRLGSAAVDSTHRVTADPFATTSIETSAAPASPLEPLRSSSTNHAPDVALADRADAPTSHGDPAPTPAERSPSPSPPPRPTSVAHDRIKNVAAPESPTLTHPQLERHPGQVFPTGQIAAEPTRGGSTYSERALTDVTVTASSASSASSATPITQATLRPADPLLAPAQAAPAAPAATPSRPTVRVHIGRLDVRATVDNTPVAPTARRDPARDTSVSLGDYLAGRKVGS
jgi:hypothetical protein